MEWGPLFQTLGENLSSLASYAWLVSFLPTALCEDWRPFYMSLVLESPKLSSLGVLKTIFPIIPYENPKHYALQK